MSRLPLVCLLLLISFALIGAPTHAANRTVTTQADSGAGSLRDTIAASSANDTISFAVTGTIALTSGELVINRNLTITGPAAGIRVSGNNASRVFNITAGNVSMSGLRITNGRAEGNSSANNNRGGGIMNAGTLTLTNCTVSNNVCVGTSGSVSGGGGIFNYDGTLTLTNCTLSGNTCTSTSDYNGGQGGGLYNLGAATITNSTISGNSAIRNIINMGGIGGDGGGILHADGPMIVKNCTISGNTASAAGGGIANLGSGPDYKLTIINSTLTGNNTNGSGGGIFSQSPMAITSSTISGNTAQGGGGILAFSAFTIHNTIVAGNTSNSSPDVATPISGMVTSQGNNFIGIVDGSDGWVASDLTGTSGAPIDPLLGPLQDNGGPTQTMKLPSNSTAVDAGSDDVLSSPLSLTTDQRGSGFPRRQGAHVDIGAYEADAAQTGSTTFTVTVTADHDDGLCGIADCTLREALNAANDTAGANTIRFANTLSGTITLTGGELVITDTLTVQGPGALILAVDGNLAGRIWRIDTAGLVVAITKLTLKRGHVTSTVIGRGGAITNNGTLTMTDCAISNSDVTSGQGGNFGGAGNPGQGGGIYNTGTLTLNNCTLNGNSVVGGYGGSGGFDPGTSGGPGGAGQGGGIYNGGTLTANNCTLSSNFATGGGGGSGSPDGAGGPGQGAGIYNIGTATLNSCTLSSNTAAGGLFLSTSQGGGILQGGSGSSRLRNCLLAGNNSPNGSGPDAFGTFISQGFNLLGKGDGSSGFTNGTNGDQVGTIATPLDAKLGPLQNNGGPTSTRALLPGSPAMDQGNTTLTSDQRALVRPYDDPTVANGSGSNGKDIGAFERQRPTLSINDVTVSEGDSGSTNLTFTVTLLDPGAQTVTVKYATSNGTAHAPDDYAAVAANTLTFSPGQTSKTLSVAVKGDALDELNETFFVNLSAPTNSVIADGQGIGTIIDDDAMPTLFINDITVSEGDNGTLGATFTIGLSTASGQPVALNYTTANGTATAPGDYTAVTTTALTIPPGQISRTITIAFKGDLLDEPNETFFVNLLAPVNATIADNQGQCTITDNDPIPNLRVSDVTLAEGNGGSINAVFTVTLVPASGQTVTVNYATDSGTAAPGSDYTAIPPTILTFAPGQTSKTVSVAVKGDLLDEPNETFFLNLSTPVNAVLEKNQGIGTITDDDATPTLSINDVTVTEGNGGTVNAAFTMKLSAASGKPVTVQYNTTNGTALNLDDYNSIAPTAFTFYPGQTTQTVNVAIKGDILDETNETFFLNLSSPTNATIADSQGIGTITDNDAPPALSINNVAVTEGNGGSTNVVFTITLSAASGLAVTVNYATANGTATSPGDYTAVATTGITFSPGQTIKTVSVTVKGDTLTESNETFFINLSAPSNSTIADNQGTCTIQNDDSTDAVSPAFKPTDPGNDGSESVEEE